MHRSLLHHTLGFLTLLFASSCANEAVAQSTFDLDPPMQADTNSQQVIASPDPSALPVFKFATAELNDGNIVVTTAAAKQKLIASLPGSGGSVAPEIDPRGIRHTANVAQTYSVAVPYTETVGGKAVTRMRTETRTRTVPVTRYRKRNAEEQTEFEEAVKAKKKEDAEKGLEEKEPEIEPAKMVMVQTPYTVSVPYTEVVDGVPTARMRQETRTRSMQVVRGKTETTAKVISTKYKFGEVKAYSINGKELDEDKLKDCISDRSPVILINNAKAITPYFEAILKPETVFLVCPEKVKP